MLFDKLAGIIEKTLQNRISLQRSVHCQDERVVTALRMIPEVFPLLQKAALFEFPSQKTWRPLVSESLKMIDDMFEDSGLLLPFPVCAFEDDQFLAVIYEDTSVDQKRIQLLNNPGGELLPLRFILGVLCNGIPLFIFARVNGLEGVVEGVSIDFSLISQKDSILLVSEDEEKKTPGLEKEIRDYFTMGVAMLSYCNLPTQFIVKETRSKTRKRLKGKITRSPDRPKYRVLHPSKIRELIPFTEADGVGVSRGAHPRRSHWRTLRSERYTHARGKKILIPSTWVGPQEGTQGNVHYKVLVDK